MCGRSTGRVDSGVNRTGSGDSSRLEVTRLGKIVFVGLGSALAVLAVYLSLGAPARPRVSLPAALSITKGVSVAPTSHRIAAGDRTLQPVAGVPVAVTQTASRLQVARAAQTIHTPHATAPAKKTKRPAAVASPSHKPKSAAPAPAPSTTSTPSAAPVRSEPAGRPAPTQTWARPRTRHLAPSSASLPGPVPSNFERARQSRSLKHRHMRMPPALMRQPKTTPRSPPPQSAQLPATPTDPPTASSSAGGYAAAPPSHGQPPGAPDTQLKRVPKR